MTTWTWSSIKSEIAAILDRTDLTAQIPDFVDAAERKISRDIKPRGFESYDSATFTASEAGAIIDQPERLLTVISFHVKTNSAGTGTGDVRKPLFRRTYSFLRAYWPDQSSTGRPKYYADMGADNFIVAPTPSAAFVYEIAYYARLAELSDSNTTNWLTEHAPQLLIYGALTETAPYLKDDPRLAVWKAMYDAEAARITAIEKAYNSDDSTAPVERPA